MTDIELPGWLALIASFFLICGGLFTLIGACGMLRMRNFFERMHPSTMGMTLGAGCVLISSILVTSVLLERPAIHELAITLFVVVSAPVTAITLMRAAITRGRPHKGEKPG